jgi:RimJ/RimL family protein N-acetyltransferase
MVRQLTGKDAQKYHAFCLDAQNRPGFFYEAALDEDTDRWLASLARDPDYFVLGAFEAGDDLVGVTSLLRRRHPRWCHRASLHQIHAVLDREEILASLLNAAVVLAEGLSGLRQLELEVFRGDTQLLEVAKRTGFRHYGGYPDAVQLDGCFYDQHLMVLWLGEAKVEP